MARPRFPHNENEGMDALGSGWTMLATRSLHVAQIPRPHMPHACCGPTAKLAIPCPREEFTQTAKRQTIGDGGGRERRQSRARRWTVTRARSLTLLPPERGRWYLSLSWSSFLDPGGLAPRASTFDDSSHAFYPCKTGFRFHVSALSPGHRAWSVINLTHCRLCVKF